MCKVWRYQFTCKHRSAHRLSKCRGTLHKHDIEGPSPICKSSISFITIRLAENCGPCQKAALEASWKTKISEAEKSLEYLEDTQFPEAVVLLEQLKEQSEAELWNSRVRFPGYKESTVPRVALGRFEKGKCSPLRHELLDPPDLALGIFEKKCSHLGLGVRLDELPSPLDVALDRFEKKCSRSDSQDDSNSVASTHPGHSDTEDQDADNSTLLEYYTPEELEEMSSDTGFDADISWECNWGEANRKEDNDRLSEPTSDPSSKQNEPQPEPTPQDLPTTAILSPSFTGPATKTPLSSREIRFDEQDQRRQLICRFDEQLRSDEHLRQLKTEFYTEWLQISRRELQDAEREKKRPVPPDPYLPSPPTPPNESEDGQSITARAAFTSILAAGVLYVCWGNYRRG